MVIDTQGDEGIEEIIEEANMNRPKRYQDVVRPLGMYQAPALYDGGDDDEWYTIFGQGPWLQRNA